MTIEQTVEIPASHRLIIPREVLAEPESSNDADYVCPYCGKKEHVPNAETIKAFNEPTIGPFDTLKELFAALDADD